VLNLVQQGQLDLDRSLASYLPGPYQHQQTPFGEGATNTVSDPRLSQVTARMILSQMSGLPALLAFLPALATMADAGTLDSSLSLTTR